jgi:hypothetical protein
MAVLAAFPVPWKKGMIPDWRKHMALFGRGKKTLAVEAEPVVVVPTPESYLFTDEQNETLNEMKVDSSGMVRLGDVTRNLLGEQVQYISQHLSGQAGVVQLGDGLNVDVSSSSYHEFRIHHDDVQEFVARLRTLREMQGRSSR